MNIDYDIDVICPDCSGKAQFTFPFRRIFQEHIESIRKQYTNATFSEISAWFKPDHGVIINELFGVRVYMRDRTWLMNLYPKMFSETQDLDKKVGLVTCANCGNIQKTPLTDELYFYKVPVGKRYLLASKKTNLIGLRNWFSSENRPYVGTTDYPRSFYQNREQIIAGIDKLLERD